MDKRICRFCGATVEAQVLALFKGQSTQEYVETSQYVHFCRSYGAVVFEDEESQDLLPYDLPGAIANSKEAGL